MMWRKYKIDSYCNFHLACYIWLHERTKSHIISRESQNPCKGCIKSFKNHTKTDLQPSEVNVLAQEKE